MGFSLLVLALVLITAKAGFWQLERAGYKLAIQQAYQEGLLAPVEVLEEIAPNVHEYLFRRVQLEGHYVSAKQFLLENRYRVQANGFRQIGYEVLTPFKLRRGQSILVNRGWIPMETMDRQQLPEVAANESLFKIMGIIAVPEKGFQLGAMDSDSMWPRRLLYIDLLQVNDRLQQEQYPAVLMLSEGKPEAYRADWQPVVDGSVKHYSYAVQWFLMSLVTIILFGFFVIKRRKNKYNE